MDNEKKDATEQTFSLEQLVTSERYRDRADLVRAVFETDCSIKQIDADITAYLKKEVK